MMGEWAAMAECKGRRETVGYADDPDEALEIARRYVETSGWATCAAIVKSCEAQAMVDEGGELSMLMSDWDEGVNMKNKYGDLGTLFGLFLGCKRHSSSTQSWVAFRKHRMPALQRLRDKGRKGGANHGR